MVRKENDRALFLTVTAKVRNIKSKNILPRVEKGGDGLRV